jgi:serine protease DegQ
MAVWFVIAVLKPNWLSDLKISSVIDSVTLREANLEAHSNNPNSFHEAVKKSSPAVVNIFNSKVVKKVAKGKSINPHQGDPWFRFFFGDQAPQEEPSSSLGSGVIVSQEGILLTNHHVIDGADEIEVALTDGRKLKAKLIGSDPETDIAVLKIDSAKLPNPITLAKMESVHVGDTVLAIGNPFGVGQTVTSGIVSALGRDHLGINTFENFIQTDAAINPGNSGGALVDTRGHLIGINTAIYSRSGGSMGIGFAIPVSLAKQVMEEILKHGRVIRGWIGVEPQNLSKELLESLGLPANTKGVLITGVLEGGPADKSGLMPKDIITQVGNRPVFDTSDLLNQISGLQPGKSITVKVRRKNASYDLPMQIGQRPK